MEQQNRPDYGKLILIPALITLGITLLRLGAEFMDLPPWLASKKAGGLGALIGISWLPPILGIYFALKLRGATGKLWWNLCKTLFLYGLAARIPVIIIMGFAIYGNWGTHYDAFALGSLTEATPAEKFLRGGVFTQLFWWLIIWTVGSGMFTGLIVSFIQSRRGRVAAGCGATICLAVLVLGSTSWPNAQALGEEKIYQLDLANCAGFTAKDAASLLGVPAGKVTRTAEKVHAALWKCTFSGGEPRKILAFSIEVAKSAKAAAADLERYRDNLEVAAGTAPFKDKLPKGAYSDILGEGLGDETVWTDVNATFTARKGNITVQVTVPADKLDKINVGKAVLSKF